MVCTRFALFVVVATKQHYFESGPSVLATIRARSNAGTTEIQFRAYVQPRELTGCSTHFQRSWHRQSEPNSGPTRQTQQNQGWAGPLLVLQTFLAKSRSPGVNRKKQERVIAPGVRASELRFDARLRLFCQYRNRKGLTGANPASQGSYGMNTWTGLFY